MRFSSLTIKMLNAYLSDMAWNGIIKQIWHNFMNIGNSDVFM